MILRNSGYEVEIRKTDKIDPDIRFDRVYDFQCCSQDELHDILHISYEYSKGKSRSIILYCDYCGNYENCSVLCEDRLVIVKFNVLYSFDLSTGKVIYKVIYKEFNDMAGAFAVYKTTAGYIIHGEAQIVMLDFDLNEKWSFGGVDIFATISDKEAFALLEDRIELYDFQDNHYVIDFDGKIIEEHFNNDH